MSDLISRQAAIDAIGELCACTLDEEARWREIIGSIPSAQQERKTGKWKPDRDNERDWYCSECDYIGNRWYKYCPNCGAKMEEK